MPGLREALDRSVGDARDEEDRQDRGDLPWGADAGLHQPPVMDHSGDGRDVDEAVEALPRLASHSAQDRGRRGDSQREQDEPCEEADLDEAALENIVPDGRPDELPLLKECAGVAGAEAFEGSGEVVSREEEGVGCEMQRRVEEGVEADETTEADEPRESRREAAQGRDGEGGEEGPEPPVAGEVGDEGDGVGIELKRARGVEVDEPCGGRKEEKVRGDLEKKYGAFRHLQGVTVAISNNA